MLTFGPSAVLQRLGVLGLSDRVVYDLDAFGRCLSGRLSHSHRRPIWQTSDLDRWVVPDGAERNGVRPLRQLLDPPFRCNIRRDKRYWRRLWPL